MDKRVVLAVAGAGKTTYIIDQLKENSRALLITYTDNNTRNIKNRIISKYGYIPEGIKILSYFTFIYSYCLKPLCGYELNLKGINFVQQIPPQILYTNKKSREHYIDSFQRIYSNRISKLLLEFELMPDVLDRLKRYFDCIYIDEIQDFAANDFNFVCQLSGFESEVVLVGDFYQHTFGTSSDGNTQKGLHDCFDKYCKKLKKSGYQVDIILLSNSYRCPSEVCDFITDNLGIHIDSHKATSGNIKFVDSCKDVDALFENDNVVKLFYQNSSKYPGNTDNWGNVKGLDDFVDVCVVLNPATLKAYQNNTLNELAATTKNKFYVACTRTKQNLYFVDEKKLKKYKI
ncbi:DNA helicase UvrD [Thiopseudomonas acetoxidans]|uniref:DNA 3'-5' helicase II n=1 Tax=Thiopseudomonas acetoxidans TaxID=3041622 RepID=A0ABT7SPL0_9GAMM|nr:DNA helicase UvrD [Thiopseudomonas sp. CY1220]MDM7857429.1 DNA helicase UvrD [Thiopseudomonas sp. CY1220]